MAHGQIDRQARTLGRQAGGQAQLFYSFNLDHHVPDDHLLRDIDRVLDLSDLHQHLAPYYSHTGRRSISVPECAADLVQNIGSRSRPTDYGRYCHHSAYLVVEVGVYTRRQT